MDNRSHNKTSGYGDMDRRAMAYDDRRSRMDYANAGRMDRYGARDRHEEEEKSGGLLSRIRRRPIRSALIGAGLAMAIGMFQRNRSNSNQSDQQRQGKQNGMAYSGRGMQGTPEAKKQTLIAWLNDAYAMEKSLVQTLRNHAHAAKEHPAIQARLERHAEESKEHAHMVRECIENLGGSVSTIKTGLSTMMGTAQGLINAPAKDTLVKNMLADSAAERLEIASYQGIITAAEELGDTETAQMARRILREEEQMSEWLEEQLPVAIRSQMAHAEA